MNSGYAESTVSAMQPRTHAAVAAASAVLLTVVLAGCAPAESTSTVPPASPTASGESSPSPLPTPEPLIVPGCDTLLPLSEAKTLFSNDTEVLGDDDSVPVRGDGLPEIDAAASNATIAKNCIWGIPNSGGGFSLAVTDITEIDAENLTDALLATGFMGVTSGNVTTLELATETGVGTHGNVHYLVDDLWIYVSAPSLDLAVDVAERALDEVRFANPTRTY